MTPAISHMDKSAIGYTNVTYAAGGKGWAFSTDVIFASKYEERRTSAFVSSAQQTHRISHREFPF